MSPTPVARHTCEAAAGLQPSEALELRDVGDDDAIRVCPALERWYDADVCQATPSA